MHEKFSSFLLNISHQFMGTWHATRFRGAVKLGLVLVAGALAEMIDQIL